MRPRVLIVDDEADIRDVLSETLGDHYELELATTAVGAIAAARERPPAAVLLDLAMPGAISGDKALRTLAAFAPVIIITANVDEELAQSLLRDGAFDYIAKPFDLGRLVDVVAAAVLHGRG